MSTRMQQSYGFSRDEHVKREPRDARDDDRKRRRMTADDAQMACALKANFFRFTPIAHQDIFKHHVDFVPTDGNHRACIAGLYQVLAGSDFVLSGNTLLLRKCLPETRSQFKTRQGLELQITIRAGQRLDLSRPESLKEALMINNIVIRRTLSLMRNLSKVGRSFVDLLRPNATFERDGMSLYTGLDMISTMCASGPLVELDIFNRVISSQNVLEMLKGHQISAPDIAQMAVLTNYNNAFYRVRRVETSLTPAHKFKRRDGSEISFAEHARMLYGAIVRDMEQPMLTAVIRGARRSDGTREMREVHVIPELCRLVGLTPRQKGSNMLRRDMISKSRMTPEQRISKLQGVVEEFNKTIPATCRRGHQLDIYTGPLVREGIQLACDICHCTPKEVGSQRDPSREAGTMFRCAKCRCVQCARCSTERNERDGFRVKLAAQAIDIAGRQLAPENITFINREGREVEKQVSGQWDNILRDLRIVPTHDVTGSNVGSWKISKWVLIFSDMFDARPFYAALSQCAKEVGVILDLPMRLAIKSADWLGEIRGLIGNEDGTGCHLPGKPDFVCVILRSTDARVYDSIKKYFHARDVVSQCVTEEKASKGTPAIFSKIMTQICTKIGAQITHCQFPQLPPRTMFIGIDAVRTKTNGFIVTLVSSVGRAYYSCAVRCAEGVSCLTPMMTAALTRLVMKTDHNAACAVAPLPECIIFYRNGIGDGDARQIEMPQDGELAQLNLAIKQVYEHASSQGIPARLPRVLFILILRKSSTRLFSLSGNPPPGTVVDDTITAHPLDPVFGLPKRDFFLVSQKTHEGSVHPTHYRVLVNETPLAIPAIEQITFKLAHVYPNWNGTIAVPAPVLLAQKLTRMIAEHGQEVPTGTLVDHLYYL